MPADRLLVRGRDPRYRSNSRSEQRLSTRIKPRPPSAISSYSALLSIYSVHACNACAFINLSPAAPSHTPARDFGKTKEQRDNRLLELLWALGPGPWTYSRVNFSNRGTFLPGCTSLLC